MPLVDSPLVKVKPVRDRPRFPTDSGVRRAPPAVARSASRSGRILAELGFPQRCYPAVHVVGTNGKSSTVAIIERLLRTAGLRVGAYLSPHLFDLRERILIDGHPVAAAGLASASERVAHAVRASARSPHDRVTWFEALTATGLLAFADHDLDVAVIEAGIGGAGDATNVLNANVVVLTSVGLDHCALLGDSVAQIAREKLAVVSPRATLIVPAELPPEVDTVVAETAARRSATVVHVDCEADYRRANRNLARAAAIVAARQLGRDLDGDRDVNVALPGRLQTIGSHPLTVLDGAHNPEAVQALLRTLATIGIDAPAIAVLAAFADKDVGGIVEALSRTCRTVVACQTSRTRALDARRLAQIAHTAGVRDVRCVPSPTRAVTLARRLASEGESVLVTGSLSLASDLLVPSRAGSRT